MHLAEVKGPVMDRLKKTDFLDEMSGVVYMSTYDAWKVLHERAEESVVAANEHSVAAAETK